MSPRIIVVLIYVLVFFVAMYSFSNVYRDWNKVDDATKSIAVLNLILGVSGILLAYWVYDDGVRLNKIERRLAE